MLRDSSGGLEERMDAYIELDIDAYDRAARGGHRPGPVCISMMAIQPSERTPRPLFASPETVCASKTGVLGGTVLTLSPSSNETGTQCL